MKMTTIGSILIGAYHLKDESFYGENKIGKFWPNTG